mmetsp:Transcript_3554/g.9485  ORF Transcript_3554/g.9485 Transcript_3554/m.9485 type:complete len:84 (-) Transcript_3554:738-989(-)
MCCALFIRHRESISCILRVQLQEPLYQTKALSQEPERKVKESTFDSDRREFTFIGMCARASDKAVCRVLTSTYASDSLATPRF